MKKVFTDIDSSGEDDEDIGNENHSTNKKFLQKTPAILFLIDARKNMFSSEFDGEKSSFIACLKCIRNVLRHKIFNEEKCHSGIILLGTKDKSNLLNLSNLTVIQDLSLIDAEHIRTIDQLLKVAEGPSYQEEYGWGELSLGDAFWLATHMFSQRPQIFNKSMILFTNDDDPVAAEKNDYNRTLASANDMYKNFIIFDLIYFGKEFNADKFFKKLFSICHHDFNHTFPDPVENLEEMEKRSIKTNYKHLTLNKLPFVIGNNFKIGVSVSFLVQKMKVPFKVKLSKSTNEKVVSKMQLFEAETGSIVDEKNIIKSQKIGQKNINFNMKELKFISNFGEVGLKLLGFKPASVISLENFVKPCAFIYPDETIYKGSSIFFTALLKRCLTKQVVPICTLCLRKYSATRFVALIAHESENSKVMETKDLPSGFIAFFLPFAEEIRQFDDQPIKKADPEQVEIAVKLIKKLKFKYKVECFSNPKLRTHWAAVEALALDLKEPDDINDTTYPNFDLMSKRIGDLAGEFMDAVYDNNYDPEFHGAPKKSRPSSSKDCESEIDIEKVERLIIKGKGAMLSNEVLKAYLKSVGEGKNLWKVKKSDLLIRAQNHLNIK